MPINKRGMTIDLGYPLSEADMEYMFIDLFPELKDMCVEWLKDIKNIRPIMLAGQIGTGKTTLINQVFLESGIDPDLRLSFDKDDFDVSIGGFLGYVFFQTLKTLDNLKIDVLKWVDDLSKATGASLDEIITAFFFKKSGAPTSPIRKVVLNLLKEQEDNYKAQLAEMLEILSDILGRPPFIFCEGIDKYQFSGGDIRLFSPTLSVLSKSPGKVLYELNLLYIVNLDFEWQRQDASIVILTSSDETKIRELLVSRTGIYSNYRWSIFPILSKLSGGNPRQAVRLQAEFEYAYEKLMKSKGEAVQYSCDRVRTDFLRSGSAGFSMEHLKTVKKDGFFVPFEEAPLYWNWILATAEPSIGKIPVKINPLLLPAIESFESLTPEDPEVEKLKLWAQEHDTSPFGLTIPAEMKIEGFIDEMNKSGLTEPALSLEKIFNALASFFLNQRFNSLYLILYQDLEVARLASDYVCGKASVLAEKWFADEIIDKNVSSFNQYTELLEKHDGLSLFYDELLDSDDVIWCEIKRDQLIGKRIIFWAKKDIGISYLDVWPHLRQFIRVLELEKEIWRDISPEDIEADLKLLEEVAVPDEQKRISKEKLERVLLSLKKRAEQNA
ncbi:hypothetical protein ES703_42949 [subsurface metagenome]